MERAESSNSSQESIDFRQIDERRDGKTEETILSIMVGKEDDYTAIDFETANSYPGGEQASLVRFDQDGQKLDGFSPSSQAPLFRS